MKKFFMLLLLITIFSFEAFSATDLLSCGFKINSCDTSAGETTLFYANKNFNDTNGNVLSSNVALAHDSNYNRVLCCKINLSITGVNLGSLNATYIDANLNCPVSSEGLMYFTNTTNARVAFASNVTQESISNYSTKMCLSVPSEFSRLNIFASSVDYRFAGYSCLYRTSGVLNGVVSSCNASFDGSSKYSTVVWAKLIENSDSLKCNSDCTSKLDGRVYSGCGAKVSTCTKVSPSCDGSVYGSWVKFDQYTEILCAEPWITTRQTAFTTESVEVTSVNNKCSNIIQKKYSVMLNNELVTMSVYVCNEEN